MKLNCFAWIVGTSAVVLTGCQTPNGTPDRTATGAVTGGMIGVASGALLCGQRSGPAALLDGTLGAITGGLVGHSMDLEAQARLRQQSPQTYAHLDQGQPLSLATGLSAGMPEWSPGVMNPVVLADAVAVIVFQFAEDDG